MRPALIRARRQHRVERLRQVVVRADLDAADDALELVDGRDHDHRQVLQLGIGLEPLEHGDAVELWHDDVEQDDVRRLLAAALQRLAAVRGRLDPMPLLLEQADEQLAIEGIVVDDEDRRLRRPHEARPPPRARSSAASTRTYSASACPTSSSPPTSSPAFAFSSS